MASSTLHWASDIWREVYYSTRFTQPPINILELWLLFENSEYSCFCFERVVGKGLGTSKSFPWAAHFLHYSKTIFLYFTEYILVLHSHGFSRAVTRVFFLNRKRCLLKSPYRSFLPQFWTSVFLFLGDSAYLPSQLDWFLTSFSTAAALDHPCHQSGHFTSSSPHLAEITFLVYVCLTLSP